MSSTQDYLKKYMSKPASLDEGKKRKLKKKKTTKSTAKKGNFAIHDEDEDSWKKAASQSDDDNTLSRKEYLGTTKTLDPDTSGRDAETVYRDAQGRKIDRVQEKIKKAEEKRREIEKQERLMEWGKGLVQREDEAERKRREQEEKFKPLARYKDDEELNEELRERERWNDPAAMFLTGKKKSKKAVRRYPLYQGNVPSNRFNIRPGYRWDGVDRSNGFEKSYFERMNAQKNKAAEAHAWSVED
ncbi:Pre-mRNA-splicing factor cwc26, partial [Modicella reniformis]